MAKNAKIELLNNIDNSVKIEEPFKVAIEIIGSCPIILHRWNCESIEAKANAKKGSKEKKSDNVESYVYRDEDNDICLPGEYLRMAMVYAAKFRQDPRSPRKSAFDLFKAGIVCLTELSKINSGTKNWDFIDKRRVVVQRNGLTRMRPAFLKGWSAEFEFLVTLPEYIDYNFFSDSLTMSGKLIGIGDFRPSYGRFDVSKCVRLKN